MRVASCWERRDEAQHREVSILYCIFQYAFSALILPSVLWRCWLDGRKGIRPVKTEWWGTGMDICLERGADLHMAHLMPLPLTVSCFSKIQIGATFLVLAHPGSPGKRTVKRVYVCMYFSFNYFKRCFWANSLNYDSTSRSAVTLELHYCDFLWICCTACFYSWQRFWLT